MLVVYLIPKHVHEFNAGRFQQGKVVDILTLVVPLEFRKSKLLNIVPDLFLSNCHLLGAALVSVLLDTRCDDQVEQRGHLWPIAVSILLVFSL